MINEHHVPLQQRGVWHADLQSHRHVYMHQPSTANGALHCATGQCGRGCADGAVHAGIRVELPGNPLPDPEHLYCPDRPWRCGHAQRLARQFVLLCLHVQAPTDIGGMCSSHDPARVEMQHQYVSIQPVACRTFRCSL